MKKKVMMTTRKKKRTTSVSELTYGGRLVYNLLKALVMRGTPWEELSEAFEYMKRERDDELHR